MNYAILLHHLSATDTTYKLTCLR
uniref:Uncharacterized protein n=1 Tax=Arundo donax TaxID=35708 RepID=A0A0A9AX36_ARUDO